ncbi:hypothetical protein CYMTET_16201 [Cymbomonas tetramitiformis]|uniref:RRM domain-containing protein n=1 Tax=Cymbomonas tetramitiformis TaxID=36881 RepID=A0AAE0GCT7_9CHLO|nr:hypothetical protein CYMTET_16201 [Cymbomonas tetramitiformis]
MADLNAAEVPRTEEVEQGSDLEHCPDKLRGRQLLSFFAEYGWYVGRVVGFRSHSVFGYLFIVCYTDGDEEELTWRQLCPKLLPTAPIVEEDARIGGWARLVTAAAQALPSSALKSSTAAPVAGGSVNDASICVVKPSADGCTTTALGDTKFCLEHGVGKRCKVDGCTRSAPGSIKFCWVHGGGERCRADGCSKFPIGSFEFCTPEAAPRFVLNTGWASAAGLTIAPVQLQAASSSAGYMVEVSAAGLTVATSFRLAVLSSARYTGEASAARLTAAAN